MIQLQRRGWWDRLQMALDDPTEISVFVKWKISEITRLIGQRRVGALVSYVVTGVTGYSPYNYYLRYLHWHDGDSTVRTIRGSEMALPLTDAGIARDLFIYRTREQTTVEQFERELCRLREEVDGPIHVLEIGANIGYFALSETRALGERAVIHAFEPDTRNLPLLYENVGRNGYDDQVHVISAAVGPKTGCAMLQRSSHSNRNVVASDGGSYPETLSLTGETRTVDVWSVDDYCHDRGVDPDEVNVVRMDVEGYETEILRGMQSVLETDGPLVLFVEIHPHLLSEEEYRWFVTTLDEHGFELVDAISEGITARPFDGSLGAEQICDLHEIHRSGYKLIAKRSSSQ